MKHLLICLCFSVYAPALLAQIAIDAPQWSYYHGATLSVYYNGQFHAVQHQLSPAINLSSDFSIIQGSFQKLVVFDNLSQQTHTYTFDQPTNANEYRVEGIVIFSGSQYQMLLRTGPDGQQNELDSSYLSSIDSGEGLQALGCFCTPDTENSQPCASGGEGASDCKVNFITNNRSKGCFATCAQGYHACCNLH